METIQSEMDSLCAVCQSEPNTPILLTCQEHHVLCLPCAQLKAKAAHAASKLRTDTSIEQLVAKYKEEVNESADATADASKEGWDTFPCPVCKEPIPYTLAHVTLGLTLVEKAPIVVLPEPEAPKCSVCENNLATKDCEECEDVFCEECAAAVHRTANLKSHAVVPIATSTRKQRKPKPMCREHNLPLDMACIKDQVPVCVECMFNGTHRERKGEEWIPHSCKSIADMASSVTTLLTAAIAKCEERFTVVDAAHAAVTETGVKLYKSCSAAEASIRSYFDDLIGRLERVRDEKLKQVNNIWRTQRTLLLNY